MATLSTGDAAPALIAGSAVDGRDVVAFVFIQVQSPASGPECLLTRLPEVEEIHRVAGEDSYVIKVRVKDVAELDRLLREKLYAMESVSSVRTTLVLRTLKDGHVVPARARN
jgi:Lrp/AsnC family leucine-responsive transcriptional regulator